MNVDKLGIGNYVKLMKDCGILKDNNKNNKNKNKNSNNNSNNINRMFIN